MNEPFLIVGIGASAGGITAMRRFFQPVGPRTGHAYVVILHLSPDHDSQLAEVLQTSTTIPVRQVRERTRLEPDHVYVIPPNKTLTIAAGHLEVCPITRIEDRRAPVDIFFRTLADTHGTRAASVILSGTGANGSMGMKHIKEAGGICLVQDPEEAEYDGMPRHAMATGLADYVLPVAEMADRLARYDARHQTIVSPIVSPILATAPVADPEPLRQVLTRLRLRTGHDFTSYKPGSVLRRIARRMGILEVDSLAAYAQALQHRPDEVQALLNDLLISVTHFFRDPSAFAALDGQILPALLASAGEGRPLRVWVPACATGEEAYSLAMLLADRTAHRDSEAFQIFATDIDRNALAVARLGHYTLNDAADVSPARLARYFDEVQDGFRVRRELRDRLLFAPQDILRDAPFFRVDLVACRNLLIYLNRSAQRRVLEVLHFALNPGGYLFLGNSESIEGAGDLFAPVDEQASLFQRRAARVRASLPALGLTAPLPAGTASPQRDRADLRPSPAASFADLHLRVLEALAPPSLLVNEDHDVVHLSERAGRYLQLAGGAPSFQLLTAVRPELRLELRSALHQAAATRGAVATPWVGVDVLGPAVRVRATVRPMPEGGGPDGQLLLVLFDEEHAASTEVEAPVPTADAGAELVEEELVRVKAQLRQTVERYETQTEELTASNEELQAMNEELRSSAEELETSKEELQSVNEEMITVNQELKVKVEEQAQATNDIQNLVSAGEMGTIFLDRDLRIKLFTPRARELFRLIPSDLGRPLTDISSGTASHDLAADVRQVLDDLTPIDREVETEQGEWYALRVLAYRTAENRIDGVVLSFANITRRKNAELAQRRLTESVAREQQRLKSVLERLPVGVLVTDPAGSVLFANPEATRLLGVSPDAGTPADLSSLEWAVLDPLTGDELPGQPLPIERAVRGEVVHHEQARIGRDGDARFVAVSAVHLPVEGESGLAIATFQDVTAERRAAEQLHDLDQRLRMVADVVPDLLWSLTADGQAEWFSSRWLDYTGQTQRAALDTGWLDVVHPDERAAARRALVEAAWRGGEELRFEHRLRRGDGTYRWFLVRARLQRDAAGRHLRWLCAAVDYHDIRQAEEQSRASEARLRLIVESVTDYAVVTIDTGGRVTGWNSGAVGIFGYAESDALGAPVAEVIVLERRAETVTDEMKVARTKGSAADEGWHRRQDGSRFYASGTLYALRDDAGGLTGYVKIARDLTGRKQSEEALQQAHAELEMRVASRTRELAETNTALQTEVSERRASEGRVKTLLHQLVTIQEDERRRIARDLHDHVGQQLTALRFQLEGLGRAREQPRVFAEHLARVEQLTERLDADVDFLAWELRSVVEEFGLDSALASFVREWSTHSGVPAEFHCTGLDGLRPPQESAVSLYRIAQEALNNIAKHAGAKRVDVLLECRDGQLALIVEDDGDGFDLEQELSGDGGGQGLHSMRERVALIGGTLEIETTPANGTTLFARVRLEPPA